MAGWSASTSSASWLSQQRDGQICIYRMLFTQHWHGGACVGSDSSCMTSMATFCDSKTVRNKAPIDLTPAPGNRRGAEDGRCEAVCHLGRCERDALGERALEMLLPVRRTPSTSWGQVQAIRGRGLLVPVTRSSASMAVGPSCEGTSPPASSAATHACGDPEDPYCTASSHDGGPRVWRDNSCE